MIRAFTGLRRYTRTAGRDNLEVNAMRRKTFGAMLIAAAVMLSLNACGQGGGEKSSAAETEPAAVTTEAESSVESSVEESSEEETEAEEQEEATEQKTAAAPAAEIETEEDTEAEEEAPADDSDGPSGKVTKIKKNRSGNLKKPEPTQGAVEPPAEVLEAMTAAETAVEETTGAAAAESSAAQQ